MLKIDLQFFGGRGASSSGGGGATGGVSLGDIKSTTSLISAREGKRQEVDEVLTTLRKVYQDTGLELNDVHIANMGDNKSVLGYYDNEGNVAINANYFDANAMNAAYDNGVKAGYHPSRNNKSGLEAVAAHELGHALTAEKAGGFNNINKASNEIVKTAMKSVGAKDRAKFTSKISGYARTNSAETVAEAFADVYCNSNKAKRESKAVVKALNDYKRK